LGPSSWQKDLSPVIQTNGWNQATVTSTAGQYFYRLVTARQSPIGALTAKGVISIGKARVDSYNSSTAPGGLYSPAVARSNACVLTLSTNAGAILIGTGAIDGKAVTGPGGTVSGGYNVTGIIEDNASVQIPDVIAPFVYGTGIVPSAGNYNGTDVTYLLQSGNYNLPSLLLTNGMTMVVTGNATLYVNGSVSNIGSATIYITPNASLKLYVNGNISLTGGGIVNGSEFPANCAIYGLPGCLAVKLAGNGDFIGTVYAPDANLTIGGNGSVLGALTANSISLVANGTLHFDESLAPSYGW
jgi:hypothetical protein